MIAQLVSELSPKLVISTGTAGAIGSVLNCGDVIITNAARFHVRSTYATYPKIDTLSNSHGQVTNTANVTGTYVKYAAANYTKLSLAGLNQCYAKIGTRPGYTFLEEKHFGLLDLRQGRECGSRTRADGYRVGGLSHRRRQSRR